MSYQQPNPPQLGATFVPGGFDDYYMPAPSPDVISPAPQRIMPEVPENMQENIAHMELEAHDPRGPMSPPNQNYGQHQNFPPRTTSHQVDHTSAGGHLNNGGYGGQTPAQGQGQGQGQWPTRQQSISSTFKQPPSVQPQAIQQQAVSHDYNQFAHSSDLPNFSPFPKLPNRPSNVPLSDDEKEAVLENTRLPVLNSNDPEMQLAWAQDALAYVDAAMLHEQRLSELQPARPVTPQVEHQLRVDAVNVVSFLADQHHPKAEFMKGMWLEFGKFGMRVDKKEAFRCYTRAASKQYARAEYRMGMQFEQSNDPIKALQHYKLGSEKGDSASNYRLGMMTLLGQHGQQQDFSRGVYLIRQAANTADENAPQGAYVLGMLQARELPQINVPESFLPFDERGAKQNIEKAAYLGFAKAQLKMGSAYELCSLGCEFNPTLSLHYNALASRQGEPEADMAISKWFLCGHEGEFLKNEELAFEYARRAAQAGLATAEFAMGYFYEIGMHAPVSIEKALEWYEKASKNGNKDAPARIESISKSRTLSKTDHEKIAINKIKSQHGSMRGQRPARLQKATAPSLPTVMDSSPSDYGDSPVVDRNATTTPYPLSDKPPTVGMTTPSSAPYGTRPATTTPYPMDNGPPRFSGGSRPPAGGFAPELRAASTRPPSTRPAFDINPNIYGGPGGPGGPGGYAPSNNSYGRGRPTYEQGDMGPLPMRPHTSVDDMGRGRGRLPVNGRNPSSGLPPGPGNYRQPAGPNHEHPESYDRPATVQPADMGYNGPDGRNKLQKQGPPQPLKKQPTLPDIGFVAPAESRQHHTRPATAQPGQESRASRPDRPSTTTPGQGRPPQQNAKPKPSETPQPKLAAGQQPSRPTPAQTQSAPQVPKPAGAKPAAAKPPLKQTATAPPGKGPKTFDEMGIGQAPKENECVVM